MHPWAPVMVLFTIAILGTVVHGWESANSRSWTAALPSLYYLPIVMAAISLGARAAAGVAMAAGLSHVLAAALGCGDPWLRALADTVLYIGVGLTAAKLSSWHGMSASGHGAGSVTLQQAYADVQNPREGASLTQLVSGLIHRFRTPLSSIEGAVWLLEDGRYPEDKREEFVRIIQKESHQLDRALSDLMHFTQPRKPRWQRADLSALLDMVIQQSGPKEHGAFFVFRKEVDPNLPALTCDGDLLCEMVLNIVMNSVQAMPGGGQIEIAAQLEAETVLITVADHGGDIPEDAAERIFDPFFTTRENGLGLGLTVSQQIVTQHCGTIALIETSRKGTRVGVRLPLNAAERHEQRKHTGG